MNTDNRICYAMPVSWLLINYDARKSNTSTLNGVLEWDNTSAEQRYYAFKLSWLPDSKLTTARAQQDRNMRRRTGNMNGSDT